MMPRDALLRFAFRLATELGWLDVGAMLAAITWTQFIGWWKFYHAEPFGELRADARVGELLSAYLNMHRDEKRRSKPCRPHEVMPYLEAEAFRIGAGAVEHQTHLGDETGWGVLFSGLTGGLSPASSEEG